MQHFNVAAGGDREATTADHHGHRLSYGMPRERATLPPPPRDLDTWLLDFVDELQRIRPHVSLRLANTIARAEYLPDRDPKKAAAAYHARQEPGLPAKPARRR